MSAIAIDRTSIRLGVIDTDRPRAAALCDALRDAGYGALDDVSAILADNGALARMPDLMLVDLDDTASTSVTALIGAASAPIIGVTGDASGEGRRRAADMGVSDFVVRPVEPAELRMRIDNAMGVTRLRRLLTDRSARLTEALRDHSTEAGTVRESLAVLAAVADFHDDDTDQHAHRVGVLSEEMARALALPDDLARMLGDAAPLHDIGKVGLSRRILLKPGSLTPSERMHMMQHVDIGAQILAAAQSPVLVLAAEIARTHHERWDGSGYTAGLSGEAIPLSGRIVAVADVWDILTHDRPYRAAWTSDRALNEIYGQAGRQFDPAVVEAFSSLEAQVLHSRSADGTVRVA